MQAEERKENIENNRMNVVIVRPDYDFNDDGSNIRPGYIQFSEDEPRYRTLAKIIGCEYIDSRVISIGGVDFDVIFDDEFMLKDAPRVPSICEMKGEKVVDVVYGTAIICNHDEEDWTSLRLIDAAHIMNCIASASLTVHNSEDKDMGLPAQDTEVFAAIVDPGADPLQGQFVDVVQSLLSEQDENGAEESEE